MFVGDFQVAEVPFGQVAGLLGSDPRALLVGEQAEADHPACSGAGLLGSDPRALLELALDGARVEGERLRAKVGPPGWPAVLSKTVELRCGQPRAHGDALVLPFSWTASGAPCLFPRLDADLELAPLGPARTQVSLRASYRPPAGRLGQGVDRLLLHRVAESTVRAFVSTACAALAEAAGGAQPSRLA
ncbi:MAG TPA: hypothetical protein VKY15_04020 [Acidimicrobiales bacterium]|nr:hypothetical protein [Acidimicrobiales bacterium]